MTGTWDGLITCSRCGLRRKPRTLPSERMDKSTLSNVIFADDDSLIVLDIGPGAICQSCDDHDRHPSRFHSRCPMCWLERKNAQRDAERLRVFREASRKEPPDATAS